MMVETKHKSPPKKIPFTLLFLLALTPLTPSIAALAISINSPDFSLAQTGTVWEIIYNGHVSADARQRDIKFLNATHGWVLSQNSSSTRDGMILHTDDGGISWQTQYYNASQRFEQIAVIENKTIWVSAVGGLYHTDNGGLSWNRTDLGEENDFFFGIYFYNKTHGWASSIHMYKTTDGGATWTVVDSWTFDDGAKMIHFVSPTEGWVIGFLGIYHTEDGGDSWKKEVNNGGWAMSFISGTEAWAVSDDWLGHMSDGKTWTEQSMPRSSPLPMNPPYFSDILFLDHENGWIVGSETKVAYTPDGGRDWFSQSFPNDVRVSAVDFINVTHGWAAGTGGYIYRTTHGNSLGVRLWLGLTDLISLAYISAIVGAGAVLVVLVRRQLKKRRAHQAAALARSMQSIELE